MVSSLLLTSCYSYQSVVGNGAQGNEQTKKWNHYVLAGLTPVEISNSKEMAGEAKDYNIEVKQTFINGLLAVITCGVYTPTTTIVTK